MQSALVLHPTYRVQHVVKMVKLQAWRSTYEIFVFELLRSLRNCISCIWYRFIRFCLLNNQELAGWVFLKY